MVVVLVALATDYSSLFTCCYSTLFLKLVHRSFCCFFSFPRFNVVRSLFLFLFLKIILRWLFFFYFLRFLFFGKCLFCFLMKIRFVLREVLVHIVFFVLCKIAFSAFRHRRVNFQRIFFSVQMSALPLFSKRTRKKKIKMAWSLFFLITWRSFSVSVR